MRRPGPHTKGGAEAASSTRHSREMFSPNRKVRPARSVVSIGKARSTSHRRRRRSGQRRRPNADGPHRIASVSKAFGAQRHLRAVARRALFTRRHGRPMAPGPAAVVERDLRQLLSPLPAELTTSARARAMQNAWSAEVAGQKRPPPRELLPSSATRPPAYRGIALPLFQHRKHHRPADARGPATTSHTRACGPKVSARSV